MSKDAKPNLITRLAKISIQNLARYRSFLLTQLVHGGPQGFMREECDLLGKMKECLEREKAIQKKNEAAATI
jgi:hypothetical protein